MACLHWLTSLWLDNQSKAVHKEVSACWHALSLDHFLLGTQLAAWPQLPACYPLARLHHAQPALVHHDIQAAPV